MLDPRDLIGVLKFPLVFNWTLLITFGVYCTLLFPFGWLLGENIYIDLPLFEGDLGNLGAYNLPFYIFFIYKNYYFILIYIII